MRFLSNLILLLTFISLFVFTAKSQDNTIANCINLINTDGYMSDGQEYKAKVDENNKARFFTTFYGGSFYRIAVCTNIPKAKILITVYDTEKNPLYCNKDFDFIPFWNFKFTSTIDCIIEVEFDKNLVIKEEVLLLIGFKEK